MIHDLYFVFHTPCYSYFVNYLDTLNPAQKEAVLHTDGPLMIVAGAGAGKTKTLTHRIAHLVAGGVHPQSILAITFTNKAAREMRERVVHLLSSRRAEEMPFVATFHGFGAYLIRENAREAGLNRNFSILDESDTASIIKEILIGRGIDPKQQEPKKFRAIISRAKGDFISQEEYAREARNAFEDTVASVWREYEKRLEKENAVDFDDLLIKSVLLLEKDGIRKKYQDRFRYIHIDEYQDTNDVQYELSKLLVGEERNICVVGDADQNIYSWRGANMKNMLHFERDYPNAKIVFLEQNYRSTKKILEAANAVIAKNTVRVPKILFTDNGDGKDIGLFSAYDEREEAEFVAGNAYALIGEGVDPDEIAVLYRANFQSRIIEESCIGCDVPYQVLGTKFFERKEVKDVLAYIRAARNRNNLADIRRTINSPARGIGKVTLLKMFAGEEGSLPYTTQAKILSYYKILDAILEATEERSVSEAVRFAIQASGMENALKNGSEEEKERFENVQELVSLAKKYDSYPPSEGIELLLTDAALASDQDSLDKPVKGIRLMTVHAAKGLEFRYVFVVGLEDGLFPHEKDFSASTEEQEEERRLFYVAVTRAREKLFLCYANMRTIFGMRQTNIPSPFIFDIPERLIEVIERKNDGDNEMVLNF